MDIKNEYPQYAAIEGHIRAARVERAVVIAEAIASFLVDTWKWIEEPPARAPVIIERRNAVRAATPRLVRKLAA